MSWRLDRTGRLNPDEVLSPAQQSFFVPFDPALMPRQAGTSWFRVSLAPYAGEVGTVFLDLNTRVTAQIPSDMRVWLVSEGQPPVQMSSNTPGLYRLPASFGSSNLFIRAAGLPAVGFVPELRAENSLNVLDTQGQFWVRIVLGLALLMGLARGIVEQREWRMWAALYAGALLVAEIWGFPSTPDGRVRLLDLPGLLAPGVALLLLPHVGRHIMRSREQSPLIDLQFIFVGLAGLILTLIPLLSNHVWTIRYLPLWPLGMVLLLPTTCMALTRGIPGAKRFLWISVLPQLGLVSFLPMPDMSFASSETAGWWISLLSLLPSFTLCASSALIALAPTPVHIIRTKRAPAQTPLGIKNALNMPTARSEAPLTLGHSGTNSLPDMQIARTAPPLVSDESAHLAAPPVKDSALPLHNLERKMRGPLDMLLNEIGALDQLKDQLRLPREVIDHTHRLSRAGRQLALLIGDISSGRHGAAVAVRERNKDGDLSDAAKAPFDLYEVILEAHNAVAEVAEAKNLALSWFTAPHLSRSYAGDGRRLARVLTLLAESAVHATDRGIVQIRVQRLPESNDPGQLLFTVSDTGKGSPPLQRSTIALVQVWELVGPDGGTLNVESGPTGTSIAFSLRLQVLGTESAEHLAHLAYFENDPGLRASLSGALRILIVSDIPVSRQMLNYYLGELPHEVREARSAEEALGMYTQTPGALLIFDGDLPEADVVSAIAAIRAFEGEHNYPLTSILALVYDDDQMERLRRAGCTHALIKPVSRTELRQLALRLAPLPKPRAPKAETPAAPMAQPDSHAARNHKNSTSMLELEQQAPKASSKGEKKKKKSRSWTLLPSLEPSAAPNEELECLKAPRLEIRSNVSDPKPISGAANFENSAGRRKKDKSLPPPENTTAQAASGMPLPVMNEAAKTPLTAQPVEVVTELVDIQVQELPLDHPPVLPATPVPSTQSARTEAERIIDDILREGEQQRSSVSQEIQKSEESQEPLTSSKPSPAARPVKPQVRKPLPDEPERERKPIPWRATPQTSTLNGPYIPGGGGEWVGEPMPIGTPIPQSTPDTALEAIKNNAESRIEPLVREVRRELRKPLAGSSASEVQAPPALSERSARQQRPLKAAVALDDLVEQGEKPRNRRSFLDLFQKKPTLPEPFDSAAQPLPRSSSEWVGDPMPITRTTPADGISAATIYANGSSSNEPSGGEWVGEPMPMPTVAAVNDDYTHLPEPETQQEPVVVPLSTLVRPEEHLNRYIDRPAGTLETQIDDIIDVTFSETPVEIDPLAPVLADAPDVPERPGDVPALELPSGTLAKSTPKASMEPLSLEPKPSRAPVTRLYLPGMEPVAPVAPVASAAPVAPAAPAASTKTTHHDGGLQIIDYPRQEEIYTLTEVVDSQPEDSPADSMRQSDPFTRPHAYKAATATEPEMPDPFLHLYESRPAATAETSVQVEAMHAGNGTPPETLAPEIDDEPVDDLLVLLETMSTRAREAHELNDRAALLVSASRLAEAATSLGLHGLIDLAHCLEEEARNGDDDAAASLLESIRESVLSAREVQELTE